MGVDCVWGPRTWILILSASIILEIAYSLHCSASHPLVPLPGMAFAPLLSHLPLGRGLLSGPRRGGSHGRLMMVRAGDEAAWPEGRLGPVNPDRPALSFEVSSMDGLARRGKIHFRRGNWTAETPAFMSVGTMGAVRGCTPDEVRDAGADILLSNTFHLMLRPGTEVIRALGDLHDFMRWDGPILTDSGGFQVWSMEGKQVTEEGVRFRSNVDGKETFLSPEGAMEVQEALGSDVCMVLDECLEWPSTEERASQSLERTLRWARRSKEGYGGAGAVFGIVQGGSYMHLRRRSVEGLVSIGFDGYAVGGLSVGEPEEILLATMQEIVPELPPGKPRYVMGLGKPHQLVEGVRRGVDMFDCVLPTRNAENGQLFTRGGSIQVRNAEFAKDPSPIDPGCGCYTCRRGFSRAYLRHLLRSKVQLGARLAVIHNTHYIHTLMRQLRGAVGEGRLDDFVTEWYAARGGVPAPLEHPGG